MAKKKVFSIILTGVIALSLAACGTNKSVNQSTTVISEAEIKESFETETDESSQTVSSGKTLIVYFSPSNSDTVDAVSAATPRVGDVSAVEYLAQMIGNTVDADVAKIVPDQAYSVVYDDAADQAKSEKDRFLEQSI